jgi:hypothetical protein
VIDVSELMTDTDFVRTITRRRPTGTRAADGSWSQTYVDADILASVQPPEQKEIVPTPEGSRGTEDTVEVWSASEMRMGDGETYEADLLVIDGVTYTVVGNEDWSVNGYYKVLARQFVPS